MLNNVHPVDDLKSLARAKARPYVTKSVHPLLIQEHVDQGWDIVKKSKKSGRLSKIKPHGVQLEDRVWSLLYHIGFTYLSGNGGASLDVDPKDPNSPTNQIDVVAIDSEVAIAVECKSAEKPSKRPQFLEELGKFSLIRQRFANAINQQFGSPTKRQIVLVMVTSNINLSENDKLRAKEANVVLLDQDDLSYYYALTSHLGSAARYQFLADLLPGKVIQGLHIRVPAIRSKMGGHICYTFSISPEYLLKIAYVSHRAKGKASDVNTYQRMIRKSRLAKIRDFIQENGIFPTNVVVNFDRKQQFERQAQDGDQENGVMGWLDIRPGYKSAWIIDGQHRLFSYSGLEEASRARLSILAFEGLPPSEQAHLFIQINSQQKSVKQSLLEEMFAELNWNSDNDRDRVGAVISKAIQILDADPESPFHQRILAADEKKDTICCISLGSMFKADSVH